MLNYCQSNQCKQAQPPVFQPLQPGNFPIGSYLTKIGQVELDEILKQNQASEIPILNISQQNLVFLMVHI